MKIGFRFVALILIICMLFEYVVYVAEETVPLTASAIFTDVKGHWAQKSIDRFAQKEWIKGYEDKSFKPNAQITR